MFDRLLLVLVFYLQGFRTKNAMQFVMNDQSINFGPEGFGAQ